jgi:hypothetical protein
MTHQLSRAIFNAPANREITFASQPGFDPKTNAIIRFETPAR